VEITISLELIRKAWRGTQTRSSFATQPLRWCTAGLAGVNHNRE